MQDQGLKTPITSWDVLLESQHDVYLALRPSQTAQEAMQVVAFLRCGIKHLFLFVSQELVHLEKNPSSTCACDVCSREATTRR